MSLWAVHLSGPSCKIQTAQGTNQNAPFHRGPVCHIINVVTYPVQFEMFCADCLILWILLKSSWPKTNIIACATAKCILIFFKIYRAIHKKYKLQHRSSAILYRSQSALHGTGSKRVWYLPPARYLPARFSDTVRQPWNWSFSRQVGAKSFPYVTSNQRNSIFEIEVPPSSVFVAEFLPLAKQICSHLRLIEVKKRSVVRVVRLQRGEKRT